MSIIQHRFFPRSMFDMDYWLRPQSLGPSTLDLFDPFDQLDHALSRNLQWIDRPDFIDSLLAPLVPKVPQKYRISIDCEGFNPKSIQTKISDDKSKLTVSAKEGEIKSGQDEDYSVREFRRTYQLPKNVETDKMISFVTSRGNLVIEFPIKQEAKTNNHRDDELLPKIVDAEDGKNKRVQMSMIMPSSIDPSKVKVTCKDRDVIIQAEDKCEKPDGMSHFYYYKRCTLPENTDFDSLKCQMEDNKLSIEAPLNAELKSTHRTIPIQKTNQVSIQTPEKN